MSKTAHPGVGETTPQTNPPAQIHHPRRGSALIRFRWPRAVSFKGGVRKYVRKYARWLRHPILLRAFGRSAVSDERAASGRQRSPLAPQAANPLIAAANSFPHGTDTEVQGNRPMSPYVPDACEKRRENEGQQAASTLGSVWMGVIRGPLRPSPVATTSPACRRERLHSLNAVTRLRRRGLFLSNTLVGGQGPQGLSHWGCRRRLAAPRL
ncbi:uncharacterized protein CCOS01_15296 [Colletotrichum costaricense]|uniref:Uncharacterized protein n=1 Tax=Colletotrichum costaricense TaxID=1209916 RepID=A0AAI9YHP5_9PEZI|nr:uncharacterized protein CCOS01_15296 [Colletotrichum costaricense]KAK1510465.1 hypothetical protein CCOS01_15296 [Colletotrichum costaricense]